MKAGDTILIPLPDTSLDSHCWMVISDPDQDDEQVVLVSFTSWRADKDQACVVEPHEHAYLSRRTCVNYADAKIVRAADIEGLIDSGKLKNATPLSNVLLARIRAGVADSRMKDRPVQILVDQCLVRI